MGPSAAVSRARRPGEENPADKRLIRDYCAIVDIDCWGRMIFMTEGGFDIDKWFLAGLLRALSQRANRAQKHKPIRETEAACRRKHAGRYAPPHWCSESGSVQDSSVRRFVVVYMRPRASPRGQ
jgi:hypothetical protein